MDVFPKMVSHLYHRSKCGSMEIVSGEPLAPLGATTNCANYTNGSRMMHGASCNSWRLLPHSIMSLASSFHLPSERSGTTSQPLVDIVLDRELR
jgi:hypothetical protein